MEKDGKALLYAHDTGLFPESTWEYLTGHPVKLNLVSLDATHAIHANYSGHMGFAADAQIRNRLVKEGLADENTIYVANHFTHNAGVTYDPRCCLWQNSMGSWCPTTGWKWNFRRKETGKSSISKKTGRPSAGPHPAVRVHGKAEAALCGKEKNYKAKKKRDNDRKTERCKGKRLLFPANNVA